MGECSSRHNRLEPFCEQLALGRRLCSLGIGKSRTHTPQPAVSIWPAEQLLGKPDHHSLLRRRAKSRPPSCPAVARPCSSSRRPPSPRPPRPASPTSSHAADRAQNPAQPREKLPIAHAVGNPSAATAAATATATSAACDDLAVSLATAQSPCFRTQKPPTPSTPSSRI